MSKELEQEVKRNLFEKYKDKFSDATEPQDLIKVVENFVLEKESLKLDQINSLQPTELKKVLSEKKQREENRIEELLGYRLKKFKQIEKDIEGLQSGLYLIGGDSNTGKTAFIINLFLDAIEANSDLYGLYFSLDDNSDVILNRMLAMKANLPINSVQKPKYLNEVERKDREKAYKEIQEMAETRFNLFDISKINKFELLEYHIQRALEENKKIIVAIDGLHNLDTGKEESIRVENITRANLIKTLVDRFNIPILTTVELRKPDTNKRDRRPSLHDINETGKFAYNANIVWLLHNENADELQNEEIGKPVTINLQYAKNKLSHIRADRYLQFFRAKCFIGEAEKPVYESISVNTKTDKKKEKVKVFNYE